MQSQDRTSPAPPATTSTDVFSLIHEIHATVTTSIDTALSWEQLNSPPVNYSLIRPIVEKYTQQGEDGKDEKGRVSSTLLSVPGGADGGESGNGNGQRASKGEELGLSLGAILYALMANRVQFITLASGDLSYAPLQSSRAAFCELLAMKILRTFPQPEDEAHLVGELVRGWCPFEGAPSEVWAGMGDDRKDVEEMTGSAIELAIVSTAKHFLSLPLIQHLVNEIYLGHLIYTPSTSRSLISDSYISERTRERRRNSSSSGGRPESVNGIETLSEVYVYNPYESGWLDHQRLRVPKWRKWLEFTSFAILMGLFIATLSLKELDRMHPVEAVFIVVSFGFILEEVATSKEHGWTIYAANAWNAFDLTYIAVFMIFLCLRVFALASHSPNTSDLAFDILACAACILFPRMVFYLIKDNVVILALRAMISRFVGFMGLSFLAFSGILFCLWTLGRGTWSIKQIIWLMLQIWFGSSYLGFSSSQSFHPIFGPIILISYAALCNVLLVTMLISILSNQFAEIAENAQAEHLFQKVVKTVEGVKSDAVFSYLPPLNLLAFIILAPLSWVCSPRTLHRINVFAIRVTSFPILIAISAFERYEYRAKQRSIRLRADGRESVMSAGLFDSFLGGGSEVLISSVFEAGPPTLAGGQVTPPRASKVNGIDSEAEPADRGISSHDNDLLDDTFFNTGSPLAKIFGKPVTAKRSSTITKTTQAQVEILKDELKEVRESQLRMEELLSKVLAGKS